MGSVRMKDKPTEKMKSWDKMLLKVKQMLSTQEEAAKNTAVLMLIDMIKKDPNISGKLIESDILITLCVDTNVRRNSLAKKIFYCVKLLTRSTKFLNLSYASCPLEFLIRLLGTSLKANRKEHIVNSILELLLIVLDRLFTVPKVFKQTVGGKSTGQIIEEVAKMFKRSPTYSLEILSSGGTILTYILKGAVFGHKQNQSWVENIAKVLKNVYEKLSSFVNLSILSTGECDKLAERNGAQAVAVMAHIGLSAIQLYTNFRHLQEPSKCESSDTKVDTHKEQILLAVLKNLDSKCTQFVSNVFVNVSNTEMYFYYFGCLRALYQAPGISQECAKLSHKLAKSGLLRLIPLISVNCNVNLRTIALKCMAEILASLSKDTFSLDDYPGGFAGLRARLLKGIQLLHKDTGKWFDGLKPSHVSESHQHTIIIFCYFFKLTSHSSEDSGSLKLLPLLTSYLNQMHSKPKYYDNPSAITKALWLIFAISSIEESRQKVTEERATNMLIRLLEAHKLQVVYTSHPALLYWCFSCNKIPIIFKKKILIFWFEENTPAKDKVLIALLMKYPNAGSCLLETIQSMKTHFAGKALQIVKRAIACQQEDDKDELLQTLRKAMPYLLTNISIKKSKLSLENIGVLLNITCRGVALHTSMAGALTTMTQLIGILVDEQLDAPLIFYTSIIQQLLQILLLSRVDNDERILVVYLNNNKFLQILHSATCTMDPTLVANANNILSYMLHFQVESAIQMEASQVFINTQHLLKYLEFKEEKLIISSLKMTYILLNSTDSQIQFPVITFATMTASEEMSFLQNLSLALQSLCLTYHVLSPGISSLGFMCLHAMMKYVSRISSIVHKHIASGPWILWFIKYYVSTKPQWCSNEFLKFICDWLPVHQRPSTTTTNWLVPFNRHCKQRKSSSNQRNELVDETVTSLATAFLKTDSLSENTRKLSRQAVKGILLANVELPKSVIEQLQDKVLSLEDPNTQMEDECTSDVA